MNNCRSLFFLLLLHLHKPDCQLFNGSDRQNEHAVAFFLPIIATFTAAHSVIESYQGFCTRYRTWMRKHRSCTSYRSCLHELFVYLIIIKYCETKWPVDNLPHTFVVTTVVLIGMKQWLLITAINQSPCCLPVVPFCNTS